MKQEGMNQERTNAERMRDEERDEGGMRKG
jgi:hypothetical protein